MAALLQRQASQSRHQLDRRLHRHSRTQHYLPSRSLELHESEVGLQAIIDPYARADAFISFGERA